MKIRYSSSTGSYYDGSTGCADKNIVNEWHSNKDQIIFNIMWI